MKKAKILLTVVAMVAIVLSAISVSAAPVFTYTVTVPATAKVGDIIDVKLVATGLETGLKIEAFGGILQYDNTKVKYVAIEPAYTEDEIEYPAVYAVLESKINGWDVMANMEFKANQIKFSAAPSTDTAPAQGVASKNIVCFKFEVLSAATVGSTIAFTIEEPSMVDDATNPIDATIVNGNVTVQGATSSAATSSTGTSSAAISSTGTSSAKTSSATTSNPTEGGAGTSILWAVLALAAVGCFVVTFSAKKATK